MTKAAFVLTEVFCHSVLILVLPILVLLIVVLPIFISRRIRFVILIPEIRIELELQFSHTFDFHHVISD